MKLKQKPRRILRNLVAILLIAAALLWVASRFIHLGRVEYTDNAQVRRNLVPIISRVQGYIKEVRFDDYEFVHEGDTLVVIDDTEYKLKVAQARSNLEKALMETGARKAAVATTANNLSVSDANIEEARVRMTQAKADWQRYEQLYGQKAVTRQQYEQMRTEFEAAEARYNMLVRQKRSTALVKEEQTQRASQNQTAIDEAQAALNLAELNLSYCTVTAPCDGVCSRKAIQTGQLIQPGQTMLQIVEQNRVWVIANYKEKQTAHISIGMPVEVKVDAVPGVTYEGTVSEISNATGAQFSIVPQDNSTGNFVKVQQRIPVKIIFTDKNKPEDLDRLRSGMNVECEVKY